MDGKFTPHQDAQRVDAANAMLRNADLNHINLSEANLQNADMSGANLSNASLFCTNMTDANLQNADLRNANLVGANLIGADLRNADLRGAKFGIYVWTTTERKRAAPPAPTNSPEYTGDPVDVTVETKEHSQYTDFSGADLSGADFRATDMRSVKWDNAAIHNTRIDDSTKTSDDFYQWWLFINGGNRNIEILRSISPISGKNLIGADLRGMDLRSIDFYGCRFRGSIIDENTLLDEPLLSVLKLLNQGSAASSLSEKGWVWANLC